jgi:hypothetical protein
LTYLSKKKQTKKKTKLHMLLTKKQSLRKSSLKKSVQKEACVACAKNFMRLYEAQFPDECPQSISKHLYARHKWHILRTMTKAELLQDYKKDKELGPCLKSSMSKKDILKVLKAHSGIVREWVLL